MSRVILLDSGLLGRLTGNVPSERVRAILDWADAILAAGHRIQVPAIADYVVRREEGVVSTGPFRFDVRVLALLLSPDLLLRRSWPLW